MSSTQTAQQLRDLYAMAVVAIHHDAQAAPGAPRFAQLDSVAQMVWIYTQLGETNPTTAPAGCQP